MRHGLFGSPNRVLTGPGIKSSPENLKKVYYAAVATYDRPFSAGDKDALSANMLLTGVVKDGVVTFAYPDDRKRNVVARRKQ